MTKRTRLFVLSSAGVLALGLCSGLVAYFGGFPTTAFSSAAGPAELRYVPNDAAVVAYANVRDVMSSEFRQRFRELVPEEEKGRTEFEQKTGINIESDIDYIVAYVMPGEDRESGGVVLARGRFNPTRLESLAVETHNAVVEPYKGKRMVRAPEGPQGRSGVVAFLEPGLIAVGDDASVRRAIDTDQGGISITSNNEIVDLMTDAQGSGNAWAVGRFDVLTSHANLPEPVASQLPAIKSFAATRRINGGVSGLFRAEARDEKAADNLRDVVRGFLALAKMQAGSKPEIQTLVDSLELGGAGNTVALSFKVAPEAIEMIIPRGARRPVAP
jgi:hypothetical protein